ncbi:fam-b protein [Plasmodium vinckei brucechwatti]|uniref:Fam-b protein n=1 Tax=Plasmodium vinckei brucechwatti TaxID=119398 RepID=A0A6V7S496_PLAVN|nr:fam-b protein [Plasmodium vinckei brucechwatti]
MQANSFNLNNFYGSSLNLLDKHNDGNYDEGDKIYTKQIIDRRETNYKYSDILSKLKDIEHDLGELIHEVTSQLEKSKKENDNNREYELDVEPNIDKRLIKNDTPLIASSYENLTEWENSENTLNINDRYFESIYNEIISGNGYNIIKRNSEFEKTYKDIMKNNALLVIVALLCLLTGGFALPFILLIIPKARYSIKKLWKLRKLSKKKLSVLE